MAEPLVTLPEQRPTTLLDIFGTLSAGWRLILGVPLALSVVVAAASFLIRPIYTASTQFLPPQQQSGAAALLGSLGGLTSSLGGSGLGAIAGLKNPSDQWVGLLKSRTIADAIIAKYKLKEQYDTDFYFQARDKLDARTRISVGKDGLIDVEVDDENPEQAAKMANSFVEELQSLSRTLAIAEPSQRRTFLEDQLKRVTTKLDSAESALRSTGISASILKTSPEATAEEMAMIKAQVSAQEVKIAAMLGRLTESSPEVRQARTELAAMKRLLVQAEAKDANTGGGDVNSYIARYREFKYQGTLFELIAKQYELARADEATAGVTLQVVDVATVPEWKSRPKRALLALGAFFAMLVLMVIYVLLRQSFREMSADPVVGPKLAAVLAPLHRREST
jgi:uncharacterized protein involved in exopolysaccharide biosynthesis